MALEKIVFSFSQEDSIMGMFVVGPEFYFSLALIVMGGIIIFGLLGMGISYFTKHSLRKGFFVGAGFGVLAWALLFLLAST